jgi:hypothetical protein
VRVIADGDRAAQVDVRVGLEVTGPRLESHDALGVGTLGLPLAKARLHDEGVLAVREPDLCEHERRDAVAVVHAGALRHLDRMEDAEIGGGRIARVAAHHAEVVELGADVRRIVQAVALGADLAAQRLGHHGHRRLRRRGCGEQQRERRRHECGSARPVPPVARAHHRIPCRNVTPSSIRRGAK